MFEIQGLEDTCCNFLEESEQSLSLTSLHKANKGCKGHELSLEFSLMLSASTPFSFVQPSTTDGQQPKHNNFMNAERVYRVVFFFVTAGFSSKPQCLDVGEQHARVIKTVSLFKTFF